LLRQRRGAARLVTTEKFDQPWYEGECIGAATFVEKGGKTTMTMNLRRTESREVSTHWPVC
jgi:hypothetical protein